MSRTFIDNLRSDITAGCRAGVAFRFPEARANDRPAKG